MSLLSISILIYYIVPRRFQWIALLVYSIVFFVLSSTPYTSIYLLVSILSTHFCAHGIYRCADQRRKSKRYLIAGILVNAGMLAALKYSNFAVNNINVILYRFGITQPIPNVSLLAPLGISFYTLQVIAYLVDVYGGITAPDKSVFKTALFVGFYPQLTSGPIAKHEEMSRQLFEGHCFDADNLLYGMQRILWGVFKKIVISARLGIIVDTIYEDVVLYNGLYIWIAAAFFLLQLYTDLSGCMDIVIGASECYGIILPENFRRPFFSRSVQEFFQRWHITLGGWLRDYIMYPVSRTGLWRKMARKINKKIPSYLAMLIVWLLFGLWHGGHWKYVIGEGLFCYSCILLGKLYEPLFKWLIQKLHIQVNTISWRIFQSVRVFVLLSIANMFFRLKNIKETLRALKYGITHWNPWILLDDSLYELGLSAKNVRLLLSCLVVLFIVDLLGEKYDLRKEIAKQNLVFRWIVWGTLLFSVLIFGYYGTGYDAESFIYGNF